MTQMFWLFRLAERSGTVVPIPSQQPFAIYNTTDSNNLSFTDNSTHGAGGSGSLDRTNDSGMNATVTAIPNVGKKMSAVPEFPSANADLDPKQSSR
jgi:hypothetical protein